MIQLPDNVLDYAMVSTDGAIILLHLKNDSNQYFTYRYHLDKVHTFNDHLEILKQVTLDNDQAYVITDHMSTEFQEPLDQNWKFAAFPIDNYMTLAQYKAQLGLISD